MNVELKEPTLSEENQQQLDAIVEKFDDAKNKNDAATVAACFTEDAILVTDTGPIYDREAIEKYYEAVFNLFHFSNHLAKADPNSIRFLGNDRYENGEWSVTLQARPAILYISRVTGQRSNLVKVTLGRIGCRSGT